MSQGHQEQAQTKVRVGVDVLREFAERCLQKVGVPRADALISADVLLESDLRGIESHGIVRLKDHYIDRINSGDTNPTPKIRVVSEAQSTALMDGDAGLGLIVGYRAMETAIRKARETGAGFVSVTNSRHFGIAGYYSTMALQHDMIGISMTNAAPLVLPTFGSQPMLGTNPISVAAPTGNANPFILDMATSVVAAGKFETATREGISIPEGWALDTDGRPTRDPRVGRISRRFMPLGSQPEVSNYKGYGLAIVVDILCGVLSGIGASPGLGNNFGHFFGALRIDAFRPAKDFKLMMDEMGEKLRETPTLPGYDRVLVPGDKEAQARDAYLKEGIPLYPRVAEELINLGHELEVSLEL